MALLLLAGCGLTSKVAPSGPAAPGKPSTTAALTLTFVAARSCAQIVPVTGGLVGNCIFGYTSGKDAYTLEGLIGDDGAVTPLPVSVPRGLDQPLFADGAGNLVAEGTLNPPASALLVIEPTSGAVKKAIPLPSPTPRLIGVTGTTAVLVGSQNGADGRVMAYDLSGMKKWDVPSPDFVKLIQAEITPAGVLVLEDGADPKAPSATRATMRRMDDGSALWEGSGEGLSVAPERVGRTVLYDDAGVPRSLATGMPTGSGPGTAAGVAFQDDLILSDPLRRITPQGTSVWTLQGTSGDPAADGKTLVVLGTNDLVVLDPATGRRIGQAPDPSPNVPSCGLSYVVVASPRVILAHPCNEAGTAVYTFRP